MTRRVKCRGYRFGVRWIATNDEPEEIDLLRVTDAVTVLLLADLFSVSPFRVAGDVLQIRDELGGR